MKMKTSAAQERLAAAADRLLGAGAVRTRAKKIYELGLAGELDHFSVDRSKIDTVADYVVRVIRANHPDLKVPPRSRWRSFEIGEVDRFGMLASAREWTDAAELARTAFDLAFVSVLLDGGAGPRWAYAEAATGETFSRSEGLAIASFVMFTTGAFSTDPFDPLRVDARALEGLTLEELADGFQVSAANPLLGLEGRLGLINKLGEAMADRADVFGTANGIRPGGLFDYLVKAADDRGRVHAPAILDVLLQTLGSVWPGKFALGGVPLGDTWPHGKLVMGDETDGLMPLHKLAQWLAYSLIEPLVWSGVEVTELDGLTALADQRNGGLLIDLGLLQFVDAKQAERTHKPDSELVVEWRALTVAGIDRVAEAVRQRLGRTAATFPLPCVLEGGTWAAGRQIAREKRIDGSPPLSIEDGSAVF